MTETLIVKFQSRWHVPGLPRRRFPAGIVDDVPVALKGVLPRTATILTSTEAMSASEIVEQTQDNIVADLVRQAEVDIAPEVVGGFDGFAMEGDEASEADKTKIENAVVSDLVVGNSSRTKAKKGKK